MKIIIISTNAGDGHDAAAKALAESAPPTAEVVVWHLESFFNSWQTFLFVTLYRILVTHFQAAIWKQLYHFAQTNTGHTWWKHITWLCPGPIKKIELAIKEFAPDVIISTHFYIPLFLEKISTPSYQLTEVITDYGWHRLWYHPGVTHYFIPSETVRAGLIQQGSTALITQTGIPVKSNLYTNEDIDTLRLRLDLPVGRPIILIMTGGTGLVPADQYLQTLVPKLTDWFVVLITGKNKPMQTRLEKIKTEKKLKHVIILGWTEQATDYIQASNIVITKPGGLTTSECAAAGRPMLLVSPIPGQEEANVDYFCKQGQTIFIKHNSEIVPAIEKILATPLDKFSNKKPPATELIWRQITG